MSTQSVLKTLSSASLGRNILRWRLFFEKRTVADPVITSSEFQSRSSISRKTEKLISYPQLAAALLAGLALRLFFIFYRPFWSGDTKFYEELARNWLYHGVYGLYIQGRLTAVHMRAPGYPAFLSGVYSVFGESRLAVMMVQAALDLVTCLLTARVAACVAPASLKTRASTIALWLAALCPFTANYSAAILTESLATLLTIAALLILVEIITDVSIESPLDALDMRALLHRAGTWLLAGFVVGLGTLVRPETPLLLIATGLFLLVHWRRRADWSKLILAGLWLLVGLILPLAPWAARNARALGRVEFLAPRYAESQGDFIPHGFYAWTGTWMVRFQDAYRVTWKLGNAPIYADALPDGAFDSKAQRTEVASLLGQYNSNLKIPPALDRKFELLARQRKSEHPLRSYLFIPVERAWRIWFTPRIELLPFSGKLWPPGEMMRSSPIDFDVTAILGILNIVFVALACVGVWKFRHSKGMALILTVLVVRTAFVTQLQTVEPRYVIECYPAILALGSLACLKRPGREVTTSRLVSFFERG